MAHTAPAPAAEPDSFGIYTSSGDPDIARLKRDCPWLKGAMWKEPWSRLEPRPGQFDWAWMDADLAACARAGLAIEIMVWVGPHSPQWIYDNGVPRVKTTEIIGVRGQRQRTEYPYYFDPNYERFFYRMIREVMAHIDTLPPDVRRAVTSYQTGEGSTGDEGPYKGEPIDPRYAIPDAQWTAWKQKAWLMWRDLITPKQPPIHLLINQGNNAQYHEWINKNMPETWRKAGHIGHGYQLNGELEMFKFLDPIINHRAVGGQFVRCRSEMDETAQGWFREAPVWNMYWLNLWGLTFGLDIFQHGARAIRDPQNAEGMAFFSKYAGRKDPETAPGAFCVLRDGLDGGDLKRFPVEKFGANEPRPAQVKRGAAIAAAFASHGAVQGAPDYAVGGPMLNRRAKAMNDVGWEIWPGNYEHFLTQYDPNSTSQGWWRVGPKDQPYGRFARAFDAASGKKEMVFNLDDKFFAGPSETPRKVRVRVVYFDKGRGSWSLKYDATGEPQKTALAVTNTGTGRWKQAVAEIADGRFANRGPHGVDLMLADGGGEDTIFHLIELERRPGSD